ncbi:hypothetical protein NE857_09060 [Nocardiopsis exhalans]|uniref:DUF6879 domain-containing protein n=1 Tax=Nocardiopsis exhalans TaxID=163604 RepID=A0ABY5DF50_9ACTN|nr:DUF6879 family protein [Nocardiopsis exhalans]USY21731.1 hypothetical protein NE857_09060 [Nocardiopsis exhalans]
MPPATYIYEQRTRILTDPARYLDAADTRTLTGHAKATLSRLTEEGRFIARKTGARSFSYQTESVLAYCREQDPNVTLFDVLATTTGEQVTEDELARELGRARSGTWWTLARRDHAPPDWSSWQHWYRGDTVQAQTDLYEKRAEWARQLKEHRARGLVRRTLWVSAQPSGMYGQYCLTRYRNVAAAGGSVHVLPAWKIGHLEHQRMLPELEVTPEAVYVRRYTRVGSRAGALRITTPELVASTGTFLGWADRQHSVTVNSFAQWHRQGAA